MNPAQILAILGLLLAFGVNPGIVSKVQGILQAKNTVSTMVVATSTQPAPQSPVFGSTPVQQIQQTSPVQAQQNVTPPIDLNPTCTLTASTTQFYSPETGWGQVVLTWSSTNATFASWSEHQANDPTSGTRAGLLNPVASGSETIPDAGNNTNALLTALFQGNGASATCTAVVPEI